MQLESVTSTGRLRNSSDLPAVLGRDHADERTIRSEWPGQVRAHSTDSGSAGLWAERITVAWTRGAAGTVELARVMAKARASLQHGEWSQLWRGGRLPFSKRKGEMLVVIGDTVEGLNAQNSAHLPLAWNTLYYLARLGTARLIQLIQAGRVHPDLSLREAQALLAEFQPGQSRRSPQHRLKLRLTRFADFVHNNFPDWSTAERKFVQAELLRLANEISQLGRPQAPDRRLDGGRPRAGSTKCLPPVASKPL